ncbi:MAG: hypothetical protein K2P58_07955 [Hyphomonadaceae bacterium]|nr:hypothetical protein [Hyphomonadaceae bacterium]
MPADNVTPFRRPPKRPIAPQRGEGLGFNTHRGKVVLAHALTLAAFSLNLFLRAPPLSLIGLVVGVAAILLVLSNRGQAMPWANTHHEHALRTLMIGYAIWVFGSLLTLISPFLALGTLLVQIAAAVWAMLRALIALVLGMMRKPIPNPRGWLI